MERHLTKELLQYQDDHIWVNQNLPALLEQYSDQWIAVKNNRVIAHNPVLSGLLSQLKDPAHSCVEFISREPLEMVL